MENLNLINIYKSALESCIQANKSESLMITVNKLYQISHVYSINNENLQYGTFFQTLALLCKKYLKSGKNIEKIQESLNNLSSLFLIKSFKDKKIIACLELGQYVKAEYQNYNAYIRNYNKRIYLIEAIDSPEIFFVQVNQEKVKIGSKYFIENLKITVEDFNQTEVKLEADGSSSFYSLNISIKVIDNLILFELKDENLWIKVQEGNVFKALQDTSLIEGNYRTEPVEKIFKFKDDVFYIDRFC